MDKREKVMYAKIKKERHPSAHLALETIRYLKDICKESFCIGCRFNNEGKCILKCETRIEDIDEIEIVERIYK